MYNVHLHFIAQNHCANEARKLSLMTTPIGSGPLDPACMVQGACMHKKKLKIHVEH